MKRKKRIPCLEVRIATGTKACFKDAHVFRSKSVSIRQKSSRLVSHMYSIDSFGCENWSWSQETMKRLGFPSSVFFPFPVFLNQIRQQHLNMLGSHALLSSSHMQVTSFRRLLFLSSIRTSTEAWHFAITNVKAMETPPAAPCSSPTRCCLQAREPCPSTLRACITKSAVSSGHPQPSR